MSTASGKSVLVVGGGVIGLCAAYYARRRGHSVTILERGAPDHAGCSLGNAGMIVPSHFVPLAAPGMVGLGLRMLPDPESPFAVRPRPSRDLLDWGWRFYRACRAEQVARAAPLLRDLHLASRRGYEELAEESGNAFGLEKRGLLLLCRSPRALHEEKHVAAQGRALGIPAEALTPEDAARLDPGVTMDIAGAVYYPLDCHLSPSRFVAEMTARLLREGVAIRYETPVTGWRADHGRIAAARTPAGELAADEYVLAGGAWTPGIARDLRLRLPMLAGKGYSFTLARPPQLPAICSILAEARVAVTPMDGALRFAGTMELAGLDLSVNAARVRGIRKAIPRYFPAFGAEDLEAAPVWSGLRPCSPDGLPYVGRPAALANLVVAAGHAMMGVSLAPITGRLVAEIVSDLPTSLDITLLHPDRYGKRGPAV